jgi:predicted O-methyltransferase YrrM
MSMTGTPITPELYQYLADLFWEEDPVLRALTADLEARGPKIQISPDEGRLLGLLVAMVKAERVLEIGTLFGYSGISMARALPPHGHLDTIEKSDLHADAAEHWFAEAGLASKVTVHRGAGLDVLPTLEGLYDVAFFDAVKHEYPMYLDHALRLVRPGGLILADNVLWGGGVADQSVTGGDVEGMREFNSRVASDPRLLSTIVGVGDGLSVSLVRE